MNRTKRCDVSNPGALCRRPSCKLIATLTRSAPSMAAGSNDMTSWRDRLAKPSSSIPTKALATSCCSFSVMPLPRRRSRTHCFSTLRFFSAGSVIALSGSAKCYWPCHMLILACAFNITATCLTVETTCTSRNHIVGCVWLEPSASGLPESKAQDRLPPPNTQVAYALQFISRNAANLKKEVVNPLTTTSCRS